MTKPIIETPKGKIVQNANGSAQLIWNTNFQPRWQKQYSETQKFVDNEVLRGCEPYIPLLTGMLVMSGILATEIGSGTVKWITPYARSQYYRGRKEGQSSTGGLRGRLWFERWKEVSGQDTIRKSKLIIEKGNK